MNIEKKYFSSYLNPLLLVVLAFPIKSKVTFITLIFMVYLIFPVKVFAQQNLTLPNNSNDWINQGVAIREGLDGQWDRYLWGAFANSVVKKGNVYYHYYQGSPVYDNTCDSVAYRAIGVSTSTDGVNWQKHTGNPVIEWSQSGSIEEGAVSSAAWLGSDGKIYIYYGANSGTGCNVNAAGRLAISSDGLTFQDIGQVISPTNSGIWGYGDEIFPIGVYESGGKWNVYYTPNGVSQSRKLGVVSGNSPTSLTSSSAVNSGNIPAWGPVSTILNGTNSYLFVNDPGSGLPIKTYKFNPAFPASLTVEKIYTFSDCSQASVMFDQAFNRWLMLCRVQPGGAYYMVKTATVNSSESPTPSEKPGDVNNDGRVDILDFQLLSNSFGKSPGQTGYNANADFNRDNRIDILDFQILSNNFGN